MLNALKKNSEPLFIKIFDLIVNVESVILFNELIEILLLITTEPPLNSIFNVFVDKI